MRKPTAVQCQKTGMGMGEVKDRRPLVRSGKTKILPSRTVDTTHNRNQSETLRPGDDS